MTEATTQGSIERNSVEEADALMAEMREAFRIGDWQRTLSVFEEFMAIKASRALRLEGECMVVRALAAVGERSAARARMNKLHGTDYKKAVHYEFLARACLDLKQYADAAEACKRAELLRIQEAPKVNGSG